MSSSSKHPPDLLLDSLTPLKWAHPEGVAVPRASPASPGGPPRTGGALSLIRAAGTAASVLAGLDAADPLLTVEPRSGALSRVSS